MLDYSPKGRRRLVQAFARRIGQLVLSRATRELLTAKSRWSRNLFGHRGQEHEAETTLRLLLRIDVADVYGPRCIPAIVRSCKKGADGRTVLRQMSGRFPRPGSLHTDRIRQLEEELSRAESSH